MTEGKIIEKEKQYMFQFPEDVSTEKQQEYMKKMEENMKTEKFIVIDPKIKVYDSKEYFQQQAKEKPAEEPKTEAEPKKDETPAKTAEEKPTEEPAKEEVKEEPKATDDVSAKVETVEVEPKKEEPGKTAFDENGSSSTD